MSSRAATVFLKLVLADGNAAMLSTAALPAAMVFFTEAARSLVVTSKIGRVMTDLNFAARAWKSARVLSVLDSAAKVIAAIKSAKKTVVERRDTIRLATYRRECL